MATVTFTLDLADLHLPQVLSALGLLYYGEPTMPIVVTPEIAPEIAPERPKQLQVRITPNVGASPVPLKGVPGGDADVTGWLRENDGWRNVANIQDDPIKGRMIYITTGEGAGWTKLAKVENREV